MTVRRLQHISCGLTILLLCVAPLAVFATDVLVQPLADLKQRIGNEYAGRSPREWAETVPGVRTKLNTADKVLALTLDACGGAAGKGYDAALIAFLERERIPATFFINARWIDTNPELFKTLARNPLFEIANHGLLHRPASVSGRGAYGINGTRSIAELVEEIEGNARKITELTGKRPRYYRSGTAFYDEVAVEVSRRLGHEVIGFTILGDAGATYRADQVKAALLKAVPGDIALLHMNHPEGQTAAGVIAAVPELKRRGVRFVRLSDYPLK